MKTRTWIQIGLLLMAVFCIVWGVVRAESHVVLVKSVTVCLECIGLG